MSALAQILAQKGHKVSGSDRNNNFELKRKLEDLGIKITGQDGSGINKKIDRVVISRAIEEGNPDLVKAKGLSLSIFLRQDILREIFGTNPGIAVAGTSGKTTVVGMIAVIFDSIGIDMTVINGGIIKNYNNNVKVGKAPFYCIETDESEGNLKGFYPRIGVLTNIGKDHMSHRKLLKVYKEFADGISDTLILNSDYKAVFSNSKKTITFGVSRDSDIRAENIRFFPDYSLFKVRGHEFRIKAPGLYNIYNALAAIAVTSAWGVSLRDAARGLVLFKGIKRRFEIISRKNGVRVIIDYAHNPDKIRAVLETARIGAKRLIAIYQPHGFGPVRMFFKELADVFSACLDNNDCLFMPEIYYAGGLVTKDISSKDIIDEVRRKNNKLIAEYFHNREDIAKKVHSIKEPGDTVIVMGARDESLLAFARDL